MRNVDDVYPLTATQRGILFHAIRSDDPEVYLEQLRFDLTGKLDEHRLREALDLVIGRHAALRTLFVWDVGDEPLHVVRTSVPSPLVIDDRRGASVDLDEVTRDLRRRGIGLDRAPVVEARLIRTHDDRAQLVWTSHHILLDGWSSALVFAEWFDTYEVLVRRSVPASRPAPAFRDYLAWIKEQGDSDADRFWAEYFDGFTKPVLLRHLPTRHPVPGSGRVERIIPSATVEALERFAKKHRVTASVVMLAAWGLVVANQGGADDVVVGSTTSGRPSELVGVEAMVGMFSTTVPVRIRLPDSRRIDDWLSDLQRGRLDAQPFEHVALSGIRRQVPAPPGETLFDSILVYENYPVANAVSEPTLRRRLVAGFDRSHYGLDLMLLPGDELGCVAMFDSEQYEPEVVDELLDQFVTMVAALVGDGVETVGALRELAATVDETSSAARDATQIASRPDSWLEQEWSRLADRPRRIADLVGSDVVPTTYELVPVPIDVAADPARLTRFVAVHQIEAVVIGLEELARMVAGLPNLGRRLPDVRSWVVVAQGTSGADMAQIRQALPLSPITLVLEWQPVDDAPIELGVTLAPGDVFDDHLLPRPVDGSRFVVLDDSGRQRRPGLPGRLNLLRSHNGQLQPLNLRARMHVDGSAVLVETPTQQAPRDVIGTADGAATPAADGGSSETWTMMHRLWESTLQIDRVDPDADFFDLGGQSSDAVTLFARVKRQFHIDLPLAVLFRRPTLRQIVELVESGGVTADDDVDDSTELSRRVRRERFLHIVEIQPGRSDLVPMFIVHGGGGNVLNLRGLANELGWERPVYGFQALGVDGIQPAHESLDEMASSYLAELLTLTPGPIVLGGYSGGGIIAMEMARRLDVAGEPVPSLVLLDTYHPSIHPQRTRLRTHARRLVFGEASDVGRRPRRGLEYVRARVRSRAERRQSLEAEHDDLATATSRDDIVPLAARDLVSRTALYDSLQAATLLPHDGPTTLFAATSEIEVYRNLPADRGWGGLIRDLTIVSTPGDHESMVQQPDVAVLATSLRALLADVDRSTAEWVGCDRTD